jgi:DnaK suppressor protein
MVALVDTEHAAELLSQARSEAESQLHSLHRDPGTPADDQADASASADDLVATGTEEALEELLTRRLEAIERAEARLREGRFGLSIQSGDPIPDGRLEIEPWAELTVEEQAGA